MELTSWMKMIRFQIFWIKMRKNQLLDEIRKIDQTLWTKITFYYIYIYIYIYRIKIR
ncbi:hypothetical protein Hanom_Chr13g01225591 [Helianthus anomalus]